LIGQVRQHRTDDRSIGKRRQSHERQDAILYQAVFEAPHEHLARLRTTQNNQGGDGHLTKEEIGRILGDLEQQTQRALRPKLPSAAAAQGA
jgi:hypothetical protein